MAASLSGVIFVWKQAGAWVQENLPFLVTFAAGIFIVVSYELFTESLELAQNTGLIVASGILGVLVLEILERLHSDSHHHHGTTHDHPHTKVEARKVLFTDAVHNVADGILLVPAFAVDVRLGIATTFAVLLHEVVQEVSEFFILKEAGYSTKKALILNFLVSGTIFIGVGLAFLASFAQNITPLLLAFAAGAFLYVVFRDLLPSTFRAIQKNEASATKYLVAGFLGIALMFGVTAITSHSHIGESDTHDGHSEESAHE